jgi:predicted small secreted protein
LIESKNHAKISSIGRIHYLVGNINRCPALKGRVMKKAILILGIVLIVVFLLPGCDGSTSPNATNGSGQNIEMSGSLQIVNNTYLVVLNIIPMKSPGFVMLDASQRASIADSLIGQLQQDGLSPDNSLTMVVPKDFINTKAVELADFMLAAPSSLGDYFESIEDLGVQGLALSVAQTIADKAIPNPPEIVTQVVNAEMTAISQAGANTIRSVLLDNGQNYYPLYIAGDLGQEIAIVVKITPPNTGTRSFSLDIPGTIAFSSYNTLAVERDAGINIPASLVSSRANFSITLPYVVPTGSSNAKALPMSSGTQANLAGIWGSSSSNVFAVGAGGTILHYDGKAWKAMASGTQADLTGVRGSSSSNVFAVGAGGTILHYDGKVWSVMSSGTSNDLNSVWCNSGSDVFAAGNFGVIMHYDGKGWSTVFFTGPMFSPQLYSVWGSSGKDVFAVGIGDVSLLGSSILHYDGTNWSSMSGKTGSVAGPLQGVWGSSSSSIFVVGVGGTILHYDGKAWSVVASGIQADLTGVWGSSSSDVFAVGGGIILHYNGKSWSSISSSISNGLDSVWGSSGRDVFAVGDLGTILHYSP